jgi:hypothetical protein
VLVFSSLFIFQLFLCVGISLLMGLCWFVPGVAGRILHDAWCSSVGLVNVSQAVLELVAGGHGSRLVFSV